MPVPRFPFIDLRLLPENEWENARYASGNLMQLHQLCVEFQSTLLLFEAARVERANVSDRLRSTAPDFTDSERNPYLDLLRSHQHSQIIQRIASRNGAIVIKGFWELLQSINKLTGESPTLFALADKDARGRANDLFSQTFGDIHRLRDSAAHPEFYSTPKKAGDHRVPNAPSNFSRDESGGTLFSNVIVQSPESVKFMATVDKNFVQYDLTDSSLAVLHCVKEGYWEAFWEAVNPDQR